MRSEGGEEGERTKTIVGARECGADEVQRLDEEWWEVGAGKRLQQRGNEQTFGEPSPS